MVLGDVGVSGVFGSAGSFDSGLAGVIVALVVSVVFVFYSRHYFFSICCCSNFSNKTRLRSGEELRRGEGGDNVTNEERVEEKEVNLTRTLDLFNSDNHITNNDVEKALGVSNTSAERYLDELEGRGKIEQVGETGRGVVYKLKV